jgi:hypothetical protein
VVNTHLVEGATRNEGDRARRSAEEGSPPGKWKDVWGRGVASPIQARTRTAPDRGSIGQSMQRETDGDRVRLLVGWMWGSN